MLSEWVGDSVHALASLGQSQGPRGREGPKCQTLFVAGYPISKLIAVATMTPDQLTHPGQGPGYKL